MTTRLIDREWDSEFAEALAVSSGNLRIICPFIKAPVIKRLLSHKPKNVRVITRTNLDDFASGVSDVAALRQLLDANARVRGIKNLHAKLYIFGRSRAIVTSANLTGAALTRNHEIGLVADDRATVKECRAYFNKLWNRGRPNITLDDVEAWSKTVTNYRLRGGGLRTTQELPDYGTDADISYSAAHASSPALDSDQAFVKFLGSDDDRESREASIICELRSGGCHWVACYPKGRRPRQVKDGDVVFMGRMTENPDDTLIIGRAIGMEHHPGRDDATAVERDRHDWKRDYPHYVRVYDAEFLDGTVGDGISLYELMDELGAHSFASTQRNLRRGEGNLNPRKSIMRQPGARLSPEGFSWLSERLDAAFSRHGKIGDEILRDLDWPEIP